MSSVAESAGGTAVSSTALSPVRQAKRKHGPRIVISNPNRSKRERGSPYVRGQFDKLLEIREHLDPAEIRACSIELSASGNSVIVAEQSVSGSSPRHLVHEYPHYIDLQLADGSSVQIEIRKFQPPTEGIDLIAIPTDRGLAEIMLIGVAANHETSY